MILIPREFWAAGRNTCVLTCFATSIAQCSSSICRAASAGQRRCRYAEPCSAADAACGPASRSDGYASVGQLCTLVFKQPGETDWQSLQLRRRTAAGGSPSGSRPSLRARRARAAPSAVRQRRPLSGRRSWHRQTMPHPTAQQRKKQVGDSHIDFSHRLPMPHRSTFPMPEFQQPAQKNGLLISDPFRPTHRSGHTLT